MADVSGYDEAMPKVQEYIEKFERALTRVRQSHGAESSLEEVRAALEVEFEAEGVKVFPEVADDAALQIVQRA